MARISTSRYWRFRRQTALGSDLGQGSRTFLLTHFFVLSRRNDKDLSLTLCIDDGLGISGLWRSAASSIIGRSHPGFIHMESRSTFLEKKFRLINLDGDIHQQ